jgi:hypothetical protein
LNLEPMQPGRLCCRTAMLLVPFRAGPAHLVQLRPGSQSCFIGFYQCSVTTLHMFERGPALKTTKGMGEIGGGMALISRIP